MPMNKLGNRSITFKFGLLPHQEVRPYLRTDLTHTRPEHT